MKFRQIITVLLFMLAAVVMKNALPDQTLVVSNSGQINTHVNDNRLVAVLSPDFFPSKVTNVIKKPELVSNISKGPMAIPGSMIALVVTALSLVFVARRSAS